MCLKLIMLMETMDTEVGDWNDAYRYTNYQ